MTTNRSVLKGALIKGSFLLGLLAFASGCVAVVEPREGYWDHDHHRWYHEHGWVACGDHDEHCR
jgi:hypothetical protein